MTSPARPLDPAFPGVAPEVYRLEGGRWTELDPCEGDAKVRAEPFEAIELDLARLWRW